MSDSVWTAFTEAIRFIVVPIVLVNLVTQNYPQLSHTFMGNIKEYILFFGGMIVAASTLESMNKPGTFKRMLYGLTSLALVCMWVFVIFGGGITEFAYGPYFVRFDLTKLVYIMLFGISLKALLIVSTFTTYKGVLEQEERRKRAERAKLRAVARPKPAPRPTRTEPLFSDFYKVAFDVTSDDAVGFSKPAPPPSDAAPFSNYKYCTICGSRAEPKDYVCKNCGAWFSKESFRFSEPASKKR